MPPPPLLPMMVAPRPQNPDRVACVAPDDPGRQQRVDAGGSGPAAEQRPADELIDSQRLARLIEAELARPPERHRVAFEHTKKEGLSIREAADALGAPPGAVRRRAHRADVALALRVEADAAVLVDLWCPVADPSHLSLGHVAPMLLLSGLVALVGPGFGYPGKLLIRSSAEAVGAHPLPRVSTQHPRR